MASDLDDAALIEHADQVGLLHRRQPVRDHQHGAALHQAFERQLHLGLGLAVERAGRLVEEKDRRVLVDGAGDGDALALAAGEQRPCLADPGVVALGQAHDEVVRRGGLGGGDHLRLVVGLGAVGDIGANGVVEQHRILGHQRDGVAERGDGDVSDILAVDQDTALLRIEEAQREIDEGALARARRTDERHGAARRHGEAHAFEHEIVRLIGEGDVVELDLAALQLERLGVGFLDQLGLAIDNAEHAARRRHALLQLRLQGRGALERAVDQERRGHEAHELAEA